MDELLRLAVQKAVLEKSSVLSGDEEESERCGKYGIMGLIMNQ